MEIYNSKDFYIRNFSMKKGEKYRMKINIFAFQRGFCAYNIETDHCKNIVPQVFPYLKFQLK